MSRFRPQHVRTRLTLWYVAGLAAVLLIYGGSTSAVMLVQLHGRCASAVDQQNGCEPGHVPEGESRAHMLGAEAAHDFSAFRTKPTPRTVWTSLVANPSSTLRRMRTMCTSMTLSRGVWRTVSFQTSRANISRETT